MSSQGLGLIVAGALTWAAMAQAEEMKFANFMPPTHPYVTQAFDPFAAEVAELTSGTVTVKLYNGGELGAGPVEQYARVVDGVAEMAFGLPGYTAQSFPLTLLTELPGVLPTVGAAEAVADHLELFANEYRRVALVGLWPNTPNLILTKGVDVQSPADLKGLKIRVPSRNSGLLVEAWGASPVSMPVTDIYGSIQTGVLDGALIDASALSAFKLAEVVDHVTMGMQTTVSPFFVVMDRHAFGRLSDAEQAALRQAGRDLGLAAHQVSLDMETKALADFATRDGRSIRVLTPEQTAAFDTGAQTMRDTILSHLTTQGLPANSIANAFNHMN